MKEASTNLERKYLAKKQIGINQLDYLKLIFAFRLDSNKFSILFKQAESDQNPNWADEFDTKKESRLLRIAIKVIQLNTYVTDMDLYQVYRLPPEMYYEHPALKLYSTIDLASCRKTKLEDCARERFYTSLVILIYATQFLVFITLTAFAFLVDDWFGAKRLGCPRPSSNELTNLFNHHLGLDFKTRLYCFYYNVSSKHKFDVYSKLFFYAYSFYFLFTRKLNYFTKTNWFPRADLSEIRFLIKPKSEITHIDKIVNIELDTIKRSLSYWLSNLMRRYNDRAVYGIMDLEATSDDLSKQQSQYRSYITRASDQWSASMYSSSTNQVASVGMNQSIDTKLSIFADTRPKRSKFSIPTLFSSTIPMITSVSTSTLTKTKQSNYLSKWSTELTGEMRGVDLSCIKGPKTKPYCLLKLMAQHNERALERYENDPRILRPETYSQAWHSTFKNFASHCTIVTELLYHAMSCAIAISFILILYNSECGSYYCPDFGLFSGENIIVISEIISFIIFSIQALSVSTSMTFVSVIAYAVAIQKLEMELLDTLAEIRSLRYEQIVLIGTGSKLKKYLRKQKSAQIKKTRKSHSNIDSDYRDEHLHDQNQASGNETIGYDNHVVVLPSKGKSLSGGCNCECFEGDLDRIIIEANGLLFKAFIKLTVSLLEFKRSSHTIGELLIPSLTTFFLTGLQVVLTEAIGMKSGRLFRLTLMGACWYALNFFLAIFARFTCRIHRLEPVCWSMLSEHIYLMKLARPDIVSQDFTSHMLSRLIFSFNHAHNLYSPRPLGLDITYQNILEQNFLIISMLSIIFSR